MTPQERKLIEDLAARIAQTQVGQKDAEAENLIRQEIGSKPDALYILVQTVLIQTMALEQAKAQIADLQQKLASEQANPPAGSTSFLGSLFGGHSSRPSAAPQPPPAQGGWQTAPPPPAQAGWQTSPPAYAPGPAPAGGGASSFLRSAATTAAGVAAGALAFEGIESLIHGFGHQGAMSGMGGMGGGSGFLQQPGGETIVNNYYDSPRDQVDNADRTDDLANADVDDPDQNDADSQDTSDDTYDNSGTGDSDSGGGDDSLV